MHTTTPTLTPTADAAAALRCAVVGWYRENARDLPWRRADRTPWGVLVAEIMLQQTPVARVLPAWQTWLDRWPTPTALADAPTADVLRAWGRLGYPRRALRLQECAVTIRDQHDGIIPDTEAELLALPGIGQYTAAAVVAFAFGRRAVVVDTNVARVTARAVAGIALPTPGGAAERRLATALAPPADLNIATSPRGEVGGQARQRLAPTARGSLGYPANKTTRPTRHDADAAIWAAASMELGAVVCTARAPRCDICPISSLCVWRSAGFPADEHAARRRSQPWAGTDRQARGRVLAALRGTDSLTRGELVALWPKVSQLERCLAGLLVDGLIESFAVNRAAEPDAYPSVDAGALATAEATPAVGVPAAEIRFSLPSRRPGVASQSPPTPPQQ